MNGAIFKEETFALLEGLRDNPKDFYREHKTELQESVQVPFKNLMLLGIPQKLSAPLSAFLETNKGLFGKFTKNDYGQGGVYDIYWGTYFPKGKKKSSSCQLFSVLNWEKIEAGFSFGNKAQEDRNRFLQNTQKNEEELCDILGELFSVDGLVFGEQGRFQELRIEASQELENPTAIEWIKSPQDYGYKVVSYYSRNEILALSMDELASRISSLFERLFPLILLAYLDDPMPEIRKYVSSNNPKIIKRETMLRPEYPLSVCASETGFKEELLASWVRAVYRKKQVVFYGPPGTGKTYIAEKIALHLIGGRDGFTDIVQFHPAYAYEDFMQGIRPKTREDGCLDYPVVPGRFLDFCMKARLRNGPCVLIVDEINRANLSRVFGELMFLLEYRGRKIPLAGGGTFSIPDNVRIIGTMNTADRSIALVDHALRRRFAFLALYPDYDVLRHYHRNTGFPVEGLVSKLKALNKLIGDDHYQVGVSFFLTKTLNRDLKDIWKTEVEPYLEEYFFDQRENVEDYRWERIAEDVLQ